MGSCTQTPTLYPVAHSLWKRDGRPRRLSCTACQRSHRTRHHVNAKIAGVEALTARGEPRVCHTADELEHIGMPVGGIGTGQLYLGGDGRLWLWDIFGRRVDLGGEYVHSPKPHSPLEQGFALNLEVSGTHQVRPFDRRGFADIRFRGEYPMARVEYRDPSAPVAFSLETFSPFIFHQAREGDEQQAAILSYRTSQARSE
jgi:uncharacterized protein (DUF608 family)